jgi:hypothetical protein
MNNTHVRLKQSALAAVVVLGLMLFGGCDDEPAPTRSYDPEAALASLEADSEEDGKAKSPVRGNLEVIGSAGVGGTVTLRLTVTSTVDGSNGVVRFRLPDSLTATRTEWTIGTLRKNAPQTFELPVRLSTVGEFKVFGAVLIDRRGGGQWAGGGGATLVVSESRSEVRRGSDTARPPTTASPSLPASMVTARLEAQDIGPVGGTTRLTLRVVANKDTPDALPNSDKLTAELRFVPSRGLALVAGQSRQPLRLKKGETRSFTFQVKIVEAGAHTITAGVYIQGSGTSFDLPAGIDTLYLDASATATEVHRQPPALRPSRTPVSGTTPGRTTPTPGATAMRTSTPTMGTANPAASPPPSTTSTLVPTATSTPTP